MRANERTPLRSGTRTLKYDPLQIHTDVETDSFDHRGSTTVHAFPTERKSQWKVRAVRFTAVASAFLSVCLIVLSFQNPEPAADLPVIPKHNSDRETPVYPIRTPQKPSLPLQKAAWSAIAQPLSILDPETLGFLAIDRPPISMPGLIFGELLEKNVALPTNSWCENLFLGSSNTESTNRVYQLPYVIDTEVHGNLSTQGVETHPAHVQANERMVEVRTIHLIITDIAQ